MTDLPILNESERQELERIAGRALSNEEAQIYRLQKVLPEKFVDWDEARRAEKARSDG